MNKLTISMPFFNTGPEYVRKAANSLTNQTFEDFRLVLVNDGGGPEVWDDLSDLDDERIVKFDLKRNSGRYYADAVVLRATDTEWFTVHDSDDYSESSRLEEMFSVSDGKEVVFAGHTHDTAKGERAFLPDIESGMNVLNQRGFRGVPPHMTNHTALWSTQAINRIGGPHPEWRIAYDTVMVALAVMRLDWTISKNVGYHVVERENSLTRNKDTGIGSRDRNRAGSRITILWRQIYRIPDEELAKKLAPSKKTIDRLNEDSERLRELL